MFFDGAPLWHCSVAVHSRVLGRPKPVSSWDRDTFNRALGIAREVMQGVGEPEPEAVLQEGGVALHVRRKATQAERDAGAPWRKLKGRP